MEPILEPVRRAAAQVVLDKTTSLSAAPPVAFQILSILRNPKSSAEGLIKLVQLDPELTAQLLRVVNTTRFGGGGVASLAEATVRLGTAEIANVAMAITMGRLLTMRKTAYIPDPPALWRHAVQCALACRKLGTYCTRLNWDSDVIFTAGLLHDLGKIVINGSPTEQLEAIATNIAEEGLSQREAEAAVLGADHAEIGGLVLEKWKMPDVVTRAVRFHHTPDKHSRDLSNLVHVGNMAAHAMAANQSWEELAPAIRPIALEHLGLPLDTISQSWTRVQEEMATIERFIAGQPV